ncbi:hypothetical protein, partial [Janthinobacterium sp. GMG1]|uniref:hypothetical protein n=1 Tax=Janthinobacterium sp. GMG1 TaxID=3096007 RepID=UPI002ACAECD4
KGYPVPTKEYRDERRKDKLKRERNTLDFLEKRLQRDFYTLSDENIKEKKEIIEFQKKVVQSLDGNVR